MAITIKQAPAESIDQLVGKVPHKVYDLTLEHITQGNGLDNLKLAGWRFLLEDEDGHYHATEFGVTADGRYTFKRVETGDTVEAFATFYNDIHVHELVQQYHYEIVCLRVPSCDVVAIWLHGDEHHHEMMIPLAPVAPHLEAGVFYPAREFMHVIEHIARERIMQEDMHIAFDDITRIEGIGPKIAGLLRQAGIFTFSHLAETDSAKLDEVLHGGGSRYNWIDTKTWQQQAKLAAAGEWDALKKLQQENN